MLKHSRIFMMIGIHAFWNVQVAQAQNTTIETNPDQPIVKSCLDDAKCIDQGWSDDQRRWWYTASQGSRLIPLKWLLALEVANQENRKFLDQAHIIDKLNYIANSKSDENPFGLPLGFAIDHDSSSNSNIMCGVFPASCRSGLMQEKWVGLNCSACHTNEITYKGKRFRVEGAPTLADFQGMEEALLDALNATVSNDQKFKKFSRQVLSENAGSFELTRLKSALIEQIAWQKLLFERNRADRIPYGHGRLDAQGHILNKVAATTLIDPQKQLFPADAPASYPHIWNTSQQKSIQWNGIVSNTTRVPFLSRDTDLGALIRNTSEVIGVFAHIDTANSPAWRSYKSSIRIGNLISLERQLSRLKSPRWPESVFGGLNQNMVVKGKEHFVTFGCANCHEQLDWDDLTSDAKEQMTPIFPVEAEKPPLGTDITLACNTLLHKSKAGKFEGQRLFAFVGEKIKGEDYTRKMLINTSIGAIFGQLDDFVGALFKDTSPQNPVGTAAPEFGKIEYYPGVTNRRLKRRARKCLETPPHELLSYKTRPLNGIWATAPYLHNGSVPTLYDLLLPSKLRVSTKYTLTNSIDNKYRPESFSVGTREFDPQKVGFMTEDNSLGNNFLFEVVRLDTGEPVPGNYNSGHEYGADLMNHQVRMELIEYLKSL